MWTAAACRAATRVRVWPFQGLRADDAGPRARSLRSRPWAAELRPVGAFPSTSNGIYESNLRAEQYWPSPPIHAACDMGRASRGRGRRSGPQYLTKVRELMSNQ